MIYLLDTNACIRYLNGREIALLERMRRTEASEIAVCSVVRLELFYGALRSQNPARTLAKQTKSLDRFFSLPLDDGAAHRGAEIRAALARIGQPIGAYDVLIAAIALANDLTLFRTTLLSSAVSLVCAMKTGKRVTHREVLIDALVHEDR